MKAQLVLGRKSSGFRAAGIISSIIITFSFANRVTAQWTPISSLNGVSITGILDINDSTIFVGGFNGYFLESTDAGNTWNPVKQTGFGADSIFGLADCGGYLFAGTNAPVSLLRSSDGGHSWSAAGGGLPTNTNVNGMTYLKGVTYAATTFGVLSSTDNGTTWMADTSGLTMGPPPYPPDIQNFGTVGITTDSSRLFTIEGVNGSGVYESTPASKAWTLIGLDSLKDLAITTVDTNIFVATDEGVFLYGGGTAWMNRNTDLPITSTARLEQCTFTESDSLLFLFINLISTGSNPHEIYMTSDLGQTWKQVTDSTFKGGTVTSMVVTSKYLIAGTQNGAWEIPISDIVTAVHEDHPPLPTGFSLSQNYPNPFNPTTNIEFRIADVGFVSLKVYDVLGREVKKLVNKVEQPGSYTVTFDASSLPSGVYFYRIRTLNYISTKKALLMK